MVIEDENDEALKEEGNFSKAARVGLNIIIIGGLVPFAGGLFSAASGAWSEHEQERVNQFLKHWMKMLQDELKEKEQTIIEIMARLDIHDEKIANRIESKEYQSLLKKTFREWAGAESEEKRIYIRNILVNAAATDLTSDDVIRLFIEWIKIYSELHFHVIAAIYNSSGISRGGVWKKIGKKTVREDSADADLYKLLFRDLSTGGIIRQEKAKTYDGRFLKDIPQKRPKGYVGSREMTSAFDNEDLYVLTELGQQFVHYAMTDLPPKLDYHPNE